MSQLTHINAAGEAHMVDVSAKAETVREARAEAYVTMRPDTLAMIIDGKHPKGDVFATARIAGIQAAKSTWQLIALPSVVTEQGGGDAERRTGAPSRAHRDLLPPVWQDRGRDGGVERRLGSGPDDLRHV